jgi:hypothetical protein
LLCRGGKEMVTGKKGELWRTLVYACFECDRTG